jgi:hypothetical protein
VKVIEASRKETGIIKTIFDIEAAYVHVWNTLFSYQKSVTALA